MKRGLFKKLLGGWKYIDSCQKGWSKIWARRNTRRKLNRTSSAEVSE